MNDVPKLPDESIWPKILEVADSNKELVSIAALAMLLSIRKNINTKFVKLLAKNDMKKINEFLGTITFNDKKLKLSLKNVLLDTANLINNEYNSGISIKKIGIDKFVDKYVADLIVQVSDNTKLLVKDMIKEGWKNEILPKHLAKNIKEVIPLDPQRAKSLLKYRQQLIKNKALSARFPDKKEWEKEINRLCQKKYEKLLYDRAMTITRTECINMANEGSRKMYEEMAKNDPFIRDNYCLIWIVTPDDRLCDSCRKMIGATCSFNGNFENRANSGGLRRPTLHPRCRCCLVCGPKTSRY